MQENTAAAVESAQVPSKSEFVKVEGGEPERTSAEGSVILAYVLMWTIMVVFVWRTVRALGLFSAETDELLKVLRRGDR